VNTVAGAEVLVDGQRVGVAPIRVLELPVGVREILVKHPDLGERRVNVDINRDQVQTIQVTLGNAPVPAPETPKPPASRQEPVSAAPDTAKPPPTMPRLPPLSAPPAPRPSR
jgi:hypothetical protein